MTLNDTTTTELHDAVSALLQDFRAGSWLPTPAERGLAEGLARARWSMQTVRAQLRDQPESVTSDPLGQVVTTTVRALASPGTNAAALLTLRVLVDALTPPQAGEG
ncbi:hypothetical protein ACFYXS_06665 [Streptomyces sp. NPDC002574]|uniref:hypothetical protein n=1 Tax=Streptomyces sp. NPDC002574 TaxID=3364652 RepID=UPI00369B0367